MKLRYIIINTAIFVCSVSSAQAETCLKPTKLIPSRVAVRYDARAGSMICPTDGPKIQVLSINKNLVQFRIDDRNSLKFLLGTSNSLLRYYGDRPLQLAIKRIYTKNERAKVGVEILPFPDAIFHSGDRQAFCAAIYLPVCALDLNKNLKIYGNQCEARTKGATLVEPAFCGLTDNRFPVLPTTLTF